VAPPLTGKSLILHPRIEGGGSTQTHHLFAAYRTLPFGSVLADAPKLVQRVTE
jgi:hypothetical protein